MAAQLSHIEKLEKRLNKYHYWLLGAIVFFFFAHGFLYILNPQDIYNANSPIKLIKYALLFGFFVLSIRAINYTKLVLLCMFFIVLFFFHYYSRELGIGVTIKSILMGFTSYAFPMTILLLYKNLKKINAVTVTGMVLTFSSVIGYVEYLFLRGLFEKFSAGGYRVVSIFVNPNNAGVLFAIMSFFLLEKGKYKTKKPNIGSTKQWKGHKTS